MKIRSALLAVLVVVSLSSSYSQKLDRFESTILEFEAEDQKSGIESGKVLFVGSSSIKRWETLEEDMAPIPVLNRGFGGSTIPEVTYYADRVLLPYNPKIIVLYCGENDLSNDEAEADLALKSLKDLTKYLNKHLPDSKLFFIAIKPSIKRWHYWSKMQEANRLIQKYISKKENYYYIDVASKMLDKDGLVLQDIFVGDNLHLNAKGYKIWSEAIKPVIETHYSD